MSDRNQFVNIDEFSSEKIKILFGVPEGSVLGHLFKNLFIDDISKTNCDVIILYADDGAFWVVDNNFSLLMSRVQLLVNNIAEWLSNNRLFPDTLKKYLMFINYRNNSLPLPNIYFNLDVLS